MVEYKPEYERLPHGLSRCLTHGAHGSRSGPSTAEPCAIARRCGGFALSGRQREPVDTCLRQVSHADRAQTHAGSKRVVARLVFCGCRGMLRRFPAGGVRLCAGEEPAAYAGVVDDGCGCEFAYQDREGEAFHHIFWKWGAWTNSGGLVARPLVSVEMGLPALGWRTGVWRMPPGTTGGPVIWLCQKPPFGLLAPLARALAAAVCLTFGALGPGCGGIRWAFLGCSGDREDRQVAFSGDP